MEGLQRHGRIARLARDLASPPTSKSAVDGCPVRTLNEADVEGENAAHLGDGYNDKFTGRKAVEFRIGQDVEDDASRST
jgi:hypothetical protein